MLCAAALIIGVWVPVVVKPAAGLLALLMLGAVAMHIRVGDPPAKSAPAATVLVMCLLVILFKTVG